MKKHISVYIALTIILLLSQACNSGSKVTSTQVEQEPTAGVQTNPTATTVPSQESGSNDGFSVPETIDLTNPALYITSILPSYKYDVYTELSGVDTNGELKEVSLLMSEETQTLPQKSQHFLVVVTGGEGSAESVVIGDQGYSVFKGVCFPFPVSSTENLSEGMPNIQKMITGQAQHVESGIDVNGFVTDKYKLTSENLVEDDELISAFAYVTRDGGFITRFELHGQSKTDYQGFDSNQFTNFTTVYNYVPVDDGSLDIAIPTVCAY